jgi:hypothetical protein
MAAEGEPSLACFLTAVGRFGNRRRAPPDRDGVRHPPGRRMMYPLRLLTRTKSPRPSVTAVTTGSALIAKGGQGPVPWRNEDRPDPAGQQGDDASMTVGVDPKAPGEGVAQSAPRFSLLLGPFAMLGATPLTPLPDLTALAQADGTRDAGTALRTLSVPRTRLGAELGFLPGAAPQADATLAALRRGERPELAALPRPRGPARWRTSAPPPRPRPATRRSLSRCRDRRPPRR